MLPCDRNSVNSQEKTSASLKYNRPNGHIMAADNGFSEDCNPESKHQRAPSAQTEIRRGWLSPNRNTTTFGCTQYYFVCMHKHTEIHNCSTVCLIFKNRARGEQSTLSSFSPSEKSLKKYLAD